MQPRELSRGARRCLDRLRWYARRYGRVHPFQEKFAERLGVSDRQVRTYLAELRAAGLVSVHQGGPGHPASYIVTSGLTSGELPGCFRAETPVAPQEPTQRQYVADHNFRAEKPQLSSSGSSRSCSDQSESTVQERREPADAATEPSPFEKAQADAIADAVRACGFEPMPDLVAKLERKRRHYGVMGFVVASAIDRAFKLVKGTSNHPQGPGWILAVVENALKPEHRGAAGETPTSYRAKWTPSPRNPKQNPLGRIADRVADIDRVHGDQRAAEDHTLAGQAQRPEQPAPVCGRCGSDGVVNGTVAWCECERGKQQRRAHPGYVDDLIRTGWRRDAIAAAVKPLPPQSELGPPRQVAIAAGGAR